MFDCCRVLLLTIYVMQPDLVATSAMSNTAAEETQDPVNTAVVAGYPMSMVCGRNSTASTIIWNFKNPTMLGESPIFDGSKTFGGFIVNISTNGFSREVILTKNDTQMEDAGIYKCIVDLPDQMAIQTAQLIVLVGPINIYVSPNKSIYSINDHLQCHANGTPQPTYAWMTAERVYIASGAYLTIEAKNTPSVIYCVATNDKLSTSMNITINISKEISAQLIAIVIVGSICVTLLILVICMAAVRLKGLEILRPGFQRETMNEPDIVQHADNDGDYVRPEELLMENQCRPIEEEHFEQDNGAACQPCQVAGPGEAALDRYVQPAFPVYGVVRKARKESMRDDKIISMSSVSDEMKQKSDAPSYEADYLDMSGFRMLSSSSENPPKPRSPMFSTSEYASIDHTLILMTPPKLN